jgi:tetrapyrrole methylase family protein/MazG family protein
VSRPLVVVVGLGPAGADLLLPAARRAFARTTHRYVRTARHPAVDDLAAEGVTFDALDRLYDSGDDLEAVYAAIATYLVDAAREHGEIVYAVPGSPNVAERTVRLLEVAAVELEIVPGVSFADLVWARLGIDPLSGVRVVDAKAFAVAAAGVSGPMLLAQCDSVFVLSDVKLTLLEMLPPDHEVTVLQRLGRSDESIRRVTLADLDRDVEPDHLTSLYVDTGEVAVASEFARLVALAERLRGPGGCPWDAQQTHHSLRRHVLEEAYEVAEAIDALPPDAPSADVPLTAYDALEDELGDLLFQVVIQSVLAAEAGGFTVADVARRIHDKLVRRHPHVFGDARVADAAEVIASWEHIKQAERGDDSLVAGVGAGLPALLAVQKLLRKADAVGLRDAAPAAGGDTKGTGVTDATSLGDALAGLVAAGAAAGIDAEAALAGWAARFRDRFRVMERLAAARGVELDATDAATTRALWDAAGAT